MESMNLEVEEICHWEFGYSWSQLIEEPNAIMEWNLELVQTGKFCGVAFETYQLFCDV